MIKGEEIPLEEILFRTGWAKHANPDGSPTSRVFKLRPKDKGELSTDVKSLTTPEISIGDKEKFNLFEIQVAAVKSLELNCIYDPLTIERDGVDNIAHSFISGLQDDDDILPGLLARKSKRFIF